MNNQPATAPCQPAPETDQECFARLAKMSRAEFDRCREPEARRLGIRASTLDAEVGALRLLTKTANHPSRPDHAPH